MSEHRVPSVPTNHPRFGVDLGVIPSDRSYWVIPGRLLAGFYPASPDSSKTTQKLRALLTVGVQHIVNLTEEGEGNYGGQGLVDYEPELLAVADKLGCTVTHRRHPIKDRGVPTIDQMCAIIREIDSAVSSGRRVYVHCWGGRGRTATVVGCYLADRGLVVGDDALAMIRYLRRTDAKADTEAPETEAQKDFVRRWQIGASSARA